MVYIRGGCSSRGIPPFFEPLSLGVVHRVMKPFLHAMRAELSALDTSPKALRSFGLVVGCVLLGIGGFLLWRSGGEPGSAVGVLGAAGGLLVAIGLASPRALRPLYLPWMALAIVLGFVMTRVLLTVVFVGVVTPIGLLMRLVGRDPMHRRPDPEAPTFWIRRDGEPRTKEHLERYY